MYHEIALNGITLLVSPSTTIQLNSFVAIEKSKNDEGHQAVDVDYSYEAGG